jgi:hypothetical protein
MDKDLFIIVGSNFGIATLIDIKSKIVNNNQITVNFIKISILIFSIKFL